MNYRALVVPVKAWSPSALISYEECPRKFQFDRAIKLCPTCFSGQLKKDRATGQMRCGSCLKFQMGNAILDFGNQVHREAENFIRSLGQLTENIKRPQVKKLLTQLRAEYKQRRVRVELEIAFTKDWKLTEWFGALVYVRFKLDVLWLASAQLTEVIDWKTGRYKPDGEYNDQLNAYAVATLAAGYGERVRSRLMFTDCGTEVVRDDAGQMERKQLPAAIKAWTTRASPLFKDKKFNPRPGSYCRWCPYSTNKGGPCPN